MTESSDLCSARKHLGPSANWVQVTEGTCWPAASPGERKAARPSLLAWWVRSGGRIGRRTDTRRQGPEGEHA